MTSFLCQNPPLALYFVQSESQSPSNGWQPVRISRGLRGSPRTLPCSSHSSHSVPDCPQISRACSFLVAFTLPFPLPGVLHHVGTLYMLSLSSLKSHSFHKHRLSTNDMLGTILSTYGWTQHFSDHYQHGTSFHNLIGYFIAIFLNIWVFIIFYFHRPI